MTPEKSDHLQNLVISLFIGLALPPAIGFGMGFWVTKDNAARMANEAVLTAETTSCVAQFTNAPNYQDRLKEFEAMDYSAKQDFFGTPQLRGAAPLARVEVRGIDLTQRGRVVVVLAPLPSAGIQTDKHDPFLLVPGILYRGGVGQPGRGRIVSRSDRICQIGGGGDPKAGQR